MDAVGEILLERIDYFSLLRRLSKRSKEKNKTGTLVVV